MKTALVTGSLNLDVISTSKDKPEVFHRKGFTKIHFGGAGRNAAVNLAQLSMPVVFMGVSNSSPIARLSVDDLQAQGVKTHMFVAPQTPDAIFSGHIFHGELISSMSATPIEDVVFPADFIDQAMQNASCVLASATHSVESLQNILESANRHKVPFLLAGDSAERTLKVLELKGEIHSLFVDKGEITHLHKHIPQCQTWEDIAKALKTTLVITEGAEPVSLITPDGKTTEIPVQAVTVEGNTLGAGDFLYSATAYYHIHQNKPLPEAVADAIREAPMLLARHHTHLGRGEELAFNIKKVMDQAETDRLTGLLNREGLQNFISGEGVRNQRITVALLDVDHFKKVNDTYGHQVGDDILKTISRLLRESVRHGDALARWGGEEFALLTVNTPRKSFEQLIERIRFTIAEYQHPELDGNHVTASIGVAFGQAGDSYEALFEKADKALYEAKTGGRNRIIISVKDNMTEPKEFGDGITNFKNE